MSLVQQTKIKQIIYLGGITNEKVLSKHLASRKMVEDILRTSGIPITSLKAGIIVGSGMALLNLEIWCRVVLDRRSSSDVAEELAEAVA